MKQFIAHYMHDYLQDPGMLSAPDNILSKYILTSK